MELFESVPNFSEGKDREAVVEIAGAASSAHVLDIDLDSDHNRAVISLAGPRERLLEPLLAAVAMAAERIDLTRHFGVHPRVGVADVVPIVPLGEATLDGGHELARELGERIWSRLRIPVYFYGHGEKWSLADIRAGRARPSLGGPDLHPTAGAVCVGARRLLVAFNVLLPGISLADAGAIARSLRESRGGMRGVQALVFDLPGGRVQLSMNLFRIDETSPAAVIAELERRGIAIGEQQLVGLCPAVAALPAANGRILEARLGASVAREGALRAAAGDDEHRALSKRLLAESNGLAALNVSQDELLAGAERCAALPPVLRAAGIPDPELESMSMLAARGLRAALDETTRNSYAARMAALDRWLD